MADNPGTENTSKYLIKTAYFVAEIANDDELSKLAMEDTVKKDTKICVLPGNTWVEAKTLPLLRKVWGLEAVAVPPPIKMKPPAPGEPPRLETVIDYRPDFVPPGHEVSEKEDDKSVQAAEVKSGSHPAISLDDSDEDPDDFSSPGKPLASVARMLAVIGNDQGEAIEEEATCVKPRSEVFPSIPVETEESHESLEVNDLVSKALADKIENLETVSHTWVLDNGASTQDLPPSELEIEARAVMKSGLHPVADKSEEEENQKLSGDGSFVSDIQDVIGVVESAMDAIGNPEPKQQEASDETDSAGHSGVELVTRETNEHTEDKILSAVSGIVSGVTSAVEPETEISREDLDKKEAADDEDFYGQAWKFSHEPSVQCIAVGSDVFMASESISAISLLHPESSESDSVESDNSDKPESEKSDKPESEEPEKPEKPAADSLEKSDLKPEPAAPDDKNSEVKSGIDGTVDKSLKDDEDMIKITKTDNKENNKPVTDSSKDDGKVSEKSAAKSVVSESAKTTEIKKPSKFVLTELDKLIAEGLGTVKTDFGALANQIKEDDTDKPLDDKSLDKEKAESKEKIEIPDGVNLELAKTLVDIPADVSERKDTVEVSISSMDLDSQEKSLPVRMRGRQKRNHNGRPSDYNNDHVSRREMAKAVLDASRVMAAIEDDSKEENVENPDKAQKDLDAKTMHDPAVIKRATDLLNSLEGLKESAPTTEMLTAGVVPSDTLDDKLSEISSAGRESTESGTHSAVGSQARKLKSLDLSRSEFRRMLKADARAAESDDIPSDELSRDLSAGSTQQDLRSLFEKEDELHLFLASDIKGKDSDKKEEKETKDTETKEKPVKDHSLTDELPLRNENVVAISQMPEAESTLLMSLKSLESDLPDLDDPFFKGKLNEGEMEVARFGVLILTTHRLWRIDKYSFACYDIENVQWSGLNEERRWWIVALDCLMVLFAGWFIYTFRANHALVSAVVLWALIMLGLSYAMFCSFFLQIGFSNTSIKLKIDKNYQKEVTEFLTQIERTKSNRRRALEKK